IDMGEGAGGGLMRAGAGEPPHWLNYVIVEDVAAKAREAEGTGAKVCAPKTEVPGFGWFVVLTDPTGAAFALWQSMKKE
ncbi:MAG: VOC family protein, partial [Candidatus Methylomirabilis sp.]|nr:VOC family protein [Deltaproteobacteria bacterium]